MHSIIWLLRNKFFILITILIIGFSILIKGYFSEAVSEYVRFDCSNKIQEMLIQTLNEDVIETMPVNNLLNVEYNDNKELVYAYIDTKQTNEILGQTSTTIAALNNEFNNNDKTINIPIGYIFSQNVFFANGITVPITISPVSTYNMKIDTKVEEYGINSSLVTVSLVYEFNFKAIIPLITNDIYIRNDIVLVTTVLYGEVPEYFFTGEKPNISIN